MALAPSSEIELKESDVLIAFMGPTGSGKSNIIDLLVDDGRTRAGGDLETTTEDITASRIQNHPTHGDSLVLIDTPGLDNSMLSGEAVLNSIMARLRKYEQKIPLAGIMYLQRIDHNRIFETEHQNLRIFGNTCVENAGKVLLVSTCWDKVDLATAETRHNDLINTIWNPLIGRGARVGQFDNTKRAAWKLVDTVLREHDTTPQKMLSTSRARDYTHLELAQRLDEQRKQIQKTLTHASQQIEKMKTPLSRRFMRVASFGCIPVDSASLASSDRMDEPEYPMSVEQWKDIFMSSCQSSNHIDSSQVVELRWYKEALRIEEEFVVATCRQSDQPNIHFYLDRAVPTKLKGLGRQGLPPHISEAFNKAETTRFEKDLKAAQAREKARAPIFASTKKSVTGSKAVFGSADTVSLVSSPSGDSQQARLVACYTNFTPPLYLRDLAFLASCIHDRDPKYHDSFIHQCYWYSRTLINVVVARYGPAIERGDHLNAAGTYTTLKEEIGHKPGPKRRGTGSSSKSTVNLEPRCLQVTGDRPEDVHAIGEELERLLVAHHKQVGRGS